MRVSAEHKSARFSDRDTLAESGSLATSKDYSSALAYELISQLRSISSCCGVVHSMGRLLEIGTSNVESIARLEVKRKADRFHIDRPQSVPLVRQNKLAHKAGRRYVGVRSMCVRPTMGKLGALLAFGEQQTKGTRVRVGFITAVAELDIEKTARLSCHQM